MAKKKGIDYDKYASGMFLRQEQYAFKVRQFYERAAEKLLRLARQHPEVSDAAFSFAQSSAVEAEAARIIRELYANVYKQIREGVEAEWEYANLSADALISSAFTGKRIKQHDSVARWFERDRQAMDAFIRRTESGMNLSERVWKLADNLRSEMETAIAVAIGQGMSADRMSREVRKYLQRPDMLFRRVRGKDGKLHLSKRTKEWTGKLGRGVYRSSYKNAMRLTRTETNMAYRTADQQRWGNLDFVIGYQVRLSNTHGDGEEEAKDDMCDLLQGDYPKWFKWTGWHPQCKCSCIPILCTLAEMNAITDAILAGKDPSTVALRGVINDVPEGFTKWIADNSERIQRAKSVPYFIRDNFRDGDITKGLLVNKTSSKAKSVTSNTTTLKPKNSASSKKSLQEDAALRHAQRTPEEVENIKTEWMNRRYRIYLDRREALFSKLTYYDNGTPLPALDRRWVAVTDAIKQGKDVTTVEKLFARFERGIATQERWDKLVWGGFTDVQRASLRKLEQATGIRKGRPMTHEQADSGHVNPNYVEKQWKWNSRKGDYVEDPTWVRRYKRFSINCQTCAPTYQLRRWGFNIEAKGNTGTAAFEYLSRHYNEAWLERPKKNLFPASAARMSTPESVEAFAKKDGVYQIKVDWNDGNSGHTFNYIRENGKGYFYDPQNNRKFKDLRDFRDYSKYVDTRGYEVIRTDTLILNPSRVKDLIQEHKPAATIEAKANTKRGKASNSVDGTARKPKKALEIAEKRHKARTQEQIDDIKRRASRRQDYLALQQNAEYQNVVFNYRNGGLKASHKSHNFDKRRGWYESTAQDIGYRNGHSVIFEKERHGVYKKKWPEGRWNGQLFEIAGAETGTANNIRNALKHCASKPDVKIAVLFFPDDNFSIKAFEAGFAKFRGLEGTAQYRKFDIIYCINKDKILLTKKPD